MTFILNVQYFTTFLQNDSESLTLIQNFNNKLIENIKDKIKNYAKIKQDVNISYLANVQEIIK